MRDEYVEWYVARTRVLPIIKSEKESSRHFILTNPFTHSEDKSDWLLILLTESSLNQCKAPKNNGNDHRFKKLLTVKRLILVITTGNVEGLVWRIYILMLGREEVTEYCSYWL